MMPGDEVTFKLSAAEVNMVLALLDSAVRALITKIMAQAAEQEPVPNVPNAGDGVAEPRSRRATAATTTADN